MEMDDRFLNEFRRDPAPGYARRLRERLLEQEETERAPRWRPLLAAAGALAVVASLFAIPAMRAGAQAVLDLFRVRSFVAVPFDQARAEKLRSLGNDKAMVIFDRQEVIQEPGRPVVQASPAMASAAAGFAVGTPSFLPAGLALDTVAVSGEGRARLGLSSARLRGLLDALDLRDVQVPAGLDGQELVVHTFPVVQQSYRDERGRLDLLQSRSPEVSLPAGVDLARVGEIGLRILGLDPGEARRVASAVDWRSTLVVPVPANASSFRQVTVQGNRGLLVTTTRPESGSGRRRRGGSVVLWTQGDRVFALEGTLGSEDLLQIAESVR
jgi:hypothetical protein